MPVTNTEIVSLKRLPPGFMLYFRLIHEVDIRLSKNS